MFIWGYWIVGIFVCDEWSMIAEGVNRMAKLTGLVGGATVDFGLGVREFSIVGK